MFFVKGESVLELLDSLFSLPLLCREREILSPQTLHFLQHRTLHLSRQLFLSLSTLLQSSNSLLETQEFSLQFFLSLCKGTARQRIHLAHQFPISLLQFLHSLPLCLQQTLQRRTSLLPFHSLSLNSFLEPPDHARESPRYLSLCSGRDLHTVLAESLLHSALSLPLYHWSSAPLELHSCSSDGVEECESVSGGLRHRRELAGESLPLSSARGHRSFVGLRQTPLSLLQSPLEARELLCQCLVPHLCVDERRGSIPQLSGNARAVSLGKLQLSRQERCSVSLLLRFLSRCCRSLTLSLFCLRAVGEILLQREHQRLVSLAVSRHCLLESLRGLLRELELYLCPCS
mmetsp:Transcript_12139/g.48828  ORF Transcript_12139/g.48828 Transcript_12139/m.48828 type:complete len:345 (-) Transcript_12139:915-1949(-)